MSPDVYQPSELDSEVAIYGAPGMLTTHRAELARHHPRTVAAVSVDDDGIYHPSVPAGYEESAANVKNDDLAELSKFWISLGIPPGERDNAYMKVIEDSKLLNKYIDRLAILSYYHQLYKELFAAREKCKANINGSLSGTQGSRHDLTVLLLSLRNLTLRLFTLVNAARTLCQKPILFPSMKLAPGKGFNTEDDWITYIKEESFITPSVAELIFIVLKFFPSMTPSAINEKVSAFFNTALSAGRILFGKHLLGSASSGYKDGQNMAMTSLKASSTSSDTLCEVLGYSRPLTAADISLHLILGINFETPFTDSDLPEKWLQQLEKRSGGSIVNAFQYNNDTAEPETLSPRIVWDMVKCESMVRDNFIMIASKQEKKGQRTVVVPISRDSTWKVPESYNLTSTVTPMFTEAHVRTVTDTEQMQHETRSARSTKSVRSTRSDVEVSALNPNIHTPHDSSIFVDAIEDQRGCYAARGVISQENAAARMARVPPDILSHPQDTHAAYEVSETRIHGAQSNGDQEIIFTGSTGHRPESKYSATNESTYSRSNYATSALDGNEWAPARGPRKVEKSDDHKYTVYDPNAERNETYTTIGKDNFPKRRNSKIFVQGLTGSGLEEVGGTPKMRRRGSKVSLERTDSTGSIQDDQASAPTGAGTPKMKRRGSKIALSNIDDESPSKLVKRRGSKVFTPKDKSEEPSKFGRRNSKVVSSNAESKNSTPKMAQSKLQDSELKVPQPIENYTIERATEEELMERARAVANDPVSYLREPSNVSTTGMNDPVFVLCDPSAFSHENTDPGVKISGESSSHNAPVSKPSNAPVGGQVMGTKAYANVQNNRVGPRTANKPEDHVVIMADDIYRGDYSEVSANTSVAPGPEHPSDAGIVFLASLTK